MINEPNTPSLSRLTVQDSGTTSFVPIEEAWKALKISPVTKKVTLDELIANRIDQMEDGSRPIKTPRNQDSKLRSNVEKNLQFLKILKEKGLILQKKLQNDDVKSWTEHLK